MTIEAPLTFPQGGTECPPGETLISTSPVVSESLTTSSTTPDKAIGRKRQKTKGGKVNKSPKKKSKMKSLLESELAQEEPSKDGSNPNTPEVTGTTEEGEELCSRTVSTSPGEKSPDLKKSPKTKCTCDGKDEAASRKSLRLRLRIKNSRLYNYGNEVRPRFFENLTDLNFSDDNQRIIFLDALGLTLQSKIIGTVEQTSPEKAVCRCGAVTIKEEESGKSPTGLIGDKIEATKQTFIMTIKPLFVEPEPEESRDIRYPSAEFASTPSGSEQQSLLPKNKPERDGEWMRWVDSLRLAERAKPKKQTKPPSQAEIAESLQRLINLGTKVRLVRSSSANM